MELFNKAGESAIAFVKNEEGAQIVEYALIIAVVSIALILLISQLTTQGGLNAWIGRVQSCLTTANSCI